MPIRDLQTEEEGLARAGVIRLGFKAKRCKTSGCGEIIETATAKCPKCKRAEFGKEFPTEAPYFVLSDAPGVAEALKTDKPTSLNIYFPFDTVDENFPAFMQSWVSSSLVCRGDSEKILHAIELVTGKPTVKDGLALRDFTEEKKEYVAGEFMPCPGLERNLYKKCERCKPNAMLLVILRDVPRLAYWQISTTSIHNIRNLTKQLNYVRNVVNDLTGSPKLSGVPFILNRVKRMVSVPKTDNHGNANGRQRVEKWFIELEIDPDWIRRMLQGLRRLADPMQRFMIPATVAPESEIVTDTTAPGGYEPPVWEPRYDDEPEEIEEATWEPAEEPAPVATPEPPANGKPKAESPRPYSPEQVREKIFTFIQKGNYRDKDTQEWLPIHLHALGKKTPNILAKIMDTAFPDGPESPEAMRHTVLYWLFGVMSTKGLSAAQANALLVWLTGKETVDYNTPVSKFVPAEARAIYDLALKEAEEEKAVYDADPEEQYFAPDPDEMRRRAAEKANEVADDILGESAPAELIAEELPF
jgi:hypothetical protein